jgi:hypothetical protein
MLNFYKTFLFISCITSVQAASGNYFDAQPLEPSSVPLRPLIRLPHPPTVAHGSGSSTPRGQIIGTQNTRTLTPRPSKRSANEQNMDVHRLHLALCGPIRPDSRTDLKVADHFPHEVNYRLGRMLGLERQEENLTKELADALIRQSMVENLKGKYEKLRAKLEEKIDALLPKLEVADREAEALVDCYNEYLKKIDDFIKEGQSKSDGLSRVIRGLQSALNSLRKKNDELTDFDREGLFQHAVNLELELHRNSQNALSKMKRFQNRREMLLRQRKQLIRNELWEREAIDDQELKEFSGMKALFQQQTQLIASGKKSLSPEQIAQRKKEEERRRALLKRL